jgi:hypothetical protein
MPWARHDSTLEIAFAERAALVLTLVLDGVEHAATVEDGDLFAVHFKSSSFP